MSILRDISLFYSMFHVAIIFMMLFRSRYPKKKTIILGAVGIGFLMILNAIGIVLLGVEAMGKLVLITCTVPSFIFFYIISEDRSGSYLFTFCLVDTVCYWVLCVTNLLEHFLGGGMFIVMLVSRLIAFPLMEIWIYKKIRDWYLDLQKIIKKGWGAYAGMTVLYYILLVALVEYPTRINGRPEYIPVFILVLALMVLNYLIIFTSLTRQYKLYESEKSERVLKEQKRSLEARLENEGYMRKLRHDMRGHTITLQGLLRQGRDKEALEYLESMERSITPAQTSVCADPYLNAQLAHYVEKFKELGVRLEADIKIGDLPLPYTEVCSIISNALENAFEASEKLPPEIRMASVQMKYKKDYLVIRLRNACSADLTVERGSIPKTSKTGKGHGIGLVSIKETAEKLGGDMVCYTENNCFVLDVMIQIV